MLFKSGFIDAMGEMYSSFQFNDLSRSADIIAVLYRSIQFSEIELTGIRSPLKSYTSQPVAVYIFSYFYFSSIQLILKI